MLAAMTGNRAAVILAWKGTRDRKRRRPKEGGTMSITTSSQNGSAQAGESDAR
jgi:hypothetical protein